MRQGGRSWHATDRAPVEKVEKRLRPDTKRSKHDQSQVADGRRVLAGQHRPRPGGTGLYPHVVDPQEAADLVALQQLGWLYCRAVDRRDYALLRSLYHDDAIDDHGTMFTGSADDYVAWLPTMLAQWEATSHTITNTIYAVDGERAEGELAATAYHRSPPPDPSEVVMHGRYLDRYEKRDGIWRFLHRSLVLDRMETRAAPPGAGEETGIAQGRCDDGDPSYARLPLFNLRPA